MIASVVQGTGRIIMPVFAVAEDDYTGQERAALVAWHLAHGECLTTAQVAAITRLSWKGAHMLMTRLSRVLPIYLDKHQWQLCIFSELA